MKLTQINVNSFDDDVLVEETGHINIILEGPNGWIKFHLKDDGAGRLEVNMVTQMGIDQLVTIHKHANHCLLGVGER